MKVWSNIAFLAPLIVALSFGLYEMAFLILSTIAASVAHHTKGNKKLKTADRLVAYTLIGANLYLLYLFEFAYPYFTSALVFAAIAFHFYFRDEEKNQDFDHSMWHLSSAVVTLMCLMGYIFR